MDTSSGTIAERLPFDVPFTILGTAPPGTTRVTLQYEETTSGNGSGSPLAPLTPLVSGVNADGVFRIQMPALDANRFFVFRLSFERHLSREGASAFRRDVVSLVDSELQAGLVELDTERLAESILRALERAVNDGVAIRPAQGTVIFEGLDAPSIRASLLTLVEPLLRLRLERGRDVARYLTTSMDLEEAIGRVIESPALRDLLRELENRPELDPRNPRNLLHLREESGELLGLNEVEVEALSRGETPGQTSKPLAEVFAAADVDAYRARYLASERALRELREWLQSLVTAGAPNRSAVDELLQSGVLTEDGLDALAALAQPRIGAIHRAQRWAEALEGYVYAVATSLAARGRELHRLSLALESKALDAVVHETLTTDPASTNANIYVGLDLGLFYAPDLSRAAAYFGANIYFRPVNKRASLRQRGGVGRRLSITVGVSFTDLKIDEGETSIEPLLGSRSNLMLGVGYRLAQSLRIGGGLLLFLKNDPNPLVTDRSLATTPYLAFSFDVDLVGALRSLTR